MALMATAERDIPDGERLARVELRVEHLEHDVRELGQAMRDLSAKVDRNFLWTVGLLITMWVTVLIAILLRT